jgi:hypothetical protein
MPSVDPVELAPFAGRQRSEERVVHNFRPGAEPPLAIVQARAHPLQLRRDSLLNLLRRHSPRYRTFRGFAAGWHMPQIHDDQLAHASLQRSARNQRNTLFQAFCQAPVRVLIGEKKVLQNLGSIPFSNRSLRQRARAGASYCIFEFLPQTFEIGIHGAV